MSEIQEHVLIDEFVNKYEQLKAARGCRRLGGSLLFPRKRHIRVEHDSGWVTLGHVGMKVPTPGFHSARGAFDFDIALHC